MSILTGILFYYMRIRAPYPKREKLHYRQPIFMSTIFVFFWPIFWKSAGFLAIMEFARYH